MSGNLPGPRSQAPGRGPRVHLRVPSWRDYRQWREARRSSRDFLQPWEPRWTAREFDFPTYLGRMRHYRRERNAGTALTFFIHLNATGELIGGITVGKIRHGVSESCELGYWMSRDHAGKGYMSEALDLTIMFVFEVLGLHRIEAACIPGNERSIRLLQKAGFREEGVMREYLRINGVWRDHQLFALLRNDVTGRRP